MKVDLKKYRESETEKDRIASLTELFPKNGGLALDAGAREGFFSVILTDFFDKVIALDLSKPNILHKNIVSVEGDITNLEYPDNYFDFVLCAEVLEHIPTDVLARATSELQRVSKKYILIGVPYKQDIRFGQTTCNNCGKTNPSYGHVNSFDKKKLDFLFNGFIPEKVIYIGKIKARTNPVSAFLMNLAGNPFGTYNQEEPCVYCRNKIEGPIKMNLMQKFITLIARSIQFCHRYFINTEPRWIHVLYTKKSSHNY